MSERKKINSKVGGDPELFIFDTSLNEYVPSCGLIGGTKAAGVSFSGAPRGVTWLEDNVAVELNFRPFIDPIDFYLGIPAMNKSVSAALKTISPNYVPKFVSAATFRSGQLDGIAKAQEIGCEPDYCAYTKAPEGGFDPKRLKRELIGAHELGTSRYAGGHLHISFNNHAKIPHYAIAMLCDAFIGLPSIIFDRQGPRRKFYGLAGLYRPKSPNYIEYRTMSNWWMNMEDIQLTNKSYTNKADWICAFFKQVFALPDLLAQNPDAMASLFGKLPLQDIQHVINNEDANEACKLYRDVEGLIFSSGVDGMYRRGAVHLNWRSLTDLNTTILRKEA